MTIVCFLLISSLEYPYHMSDIILAKYNRMNLLFVKADPNIAPGARELSIVLYLNLYDLQQFAWHLSGIQ